MTEKNAKTVVKKPSKTDQMRNSLSGVLAALNFGDQFGLGGQTGFVLSNTATQYLNLRYYLISNDRQLLSHMYAEQALVRTLIDQPVEDGMRAGFTIKTNNLDAGEIEMLQKWMRDSGAWDAYIQAIKWKRLFGGGGVMFLTTQKANTPFSLDRINKFSQIEFRAADMWELYYNKIDMHETQVSAKNVLNDPMFNYYGVQVDPSRVLKLVGDSAPSFITMQLRGWGLSKIEGMVRPLNQYYKNEDVVFDLMDEAKIDIYRIEGFNESLINEDAIAQVVKRVQSANALKNYNNAVTMDKNDEYQQKVMSFTGLAEMGGFNRETVAGAMKFPMTKLFGQSAKGFSSGEEDTENYNGMIESDIRIKAHPDIITLLNIGCKKLFDFVPEDIQISFPSLQTLSAEQEEKVKDSQWKRVKEIYESGLSSDIEAKESINKGSLLPVEIDESAPADDPLAARSAMTIADNAPKPDAKDKTKKPGKK